MHRSLILFIFLSLSCGLFGQNDSLQGRKIDIYAKASQDTLQGKPLVNFKAALLNGDSFNLDAHRGKVIMLNFWFVGCPPCMGEMPDLNNIYRTYKDSGVVFVSLARNSPEQLIKFKEGKYSRPPETIEYPIIPDCSSIAAKYGITGFPTTVLIDRNGIIRLIYSGASVQSLKKYIAFYGDRSLSKEWKKIVKQYSNVKEPEVSEILSGLLNDLLREPG
jgi:thiol-disulfide isomerase/thioredoxin